jgi:predicted lipoprotein with Yx(FWY)xxD motif
MTVRGGYRFLALFAVGALVLAACGGDDDDSASGSGTSTTAPDATSTTTGATDSFTVALAETSLGETLVDRDGKTLYLFEADSGGTSACNAGCDTTWPPLTIDGEVTVGPGLDAADFATITREDGSKQVTSYGKPLYTYAADAAPGDTNGQGVGDVWYAVGADGNALSGNPNSSTASTEPNTSTAPKSEQGSGAYGY